MATGLTGRNGQLAARPVAAECVTETGCVRTHDLAPVANGALEMLLKLTIVKTQNVKVYKFLFVCF